MIRVGCVLLCSSCAEVGGVPEARREAGQNRAEQSAGPRQRLDRAEEHRVSSGEGQIARMTKDEGKARSTFTVARTEQAKIVQAQPSRHERSTRRPSNSVSVWPPARDHNRLHRVK